MLIVRRYYHQCHGGPIVFAAFGTMGDKHLVLVGMLSHSMIMASARDVAGCLKSWRADARTADASGQYTL